MGTASWGWRSFSAATSDIWIRLDIGHGICVPLAPMESSADTSSQAIDYVPRVSFGYMTSSQGLRADASDKVALTKVRR